MDYQGDQENVVSQEKLVTQEPLDDQELQDEKDLLEDPVKKDLVETQECQEKLDHPVK